MNDFQYLVPLNVNGMPQRNDMETFYVSLGAHMCGITGHTEEFVRHKGVPWHKASNGFLFFFYVISTNLLNKRSSGRRFQTWRLYDATVVL